MMSIRRVFFAIMLPKSAQQVLSSVIHSLKQSIPQNDVRWTAVENLHITLQFIQSIQSDDLVLLIEQVRKRLKNTATFQMKLSELEWFPSIDHPTCISITVEPQEVLTAVSSAIGQAIIYCNYPVESRLFRGHITVGRLKNYHPAPSLLSKIVMPILPPIVVNEIYLMESKPGLDGSNYYPLEKFDFYSI